MSDLNDYGGPDPVGSAFWRVQQWADQNPVKAVGGAVCAADGAAWLTMPHTLWAWATAAPFAFGLIHTGAALAWVIWFEAREKRVQRWLRRFDLSWFVPPDERIGHDDDEPLQGWFEWWPKQRRETAKTATEALDEAEAQALEEAIR